MTSKKEYEQSNEITRHNVNDTAVHIDVDNDECVKTSVSQVQEINRRRYANGNNILFINMVNDNV